MSLDEFDDIFEAMDKIDEERIEFKEKVSDDMQQWEIEVKMFKGENLVGINVRNINPNEFDKVKDSVFREVKKAWTVLPSDNFIKVEVKEEEEFAEIVEQTYTNQDVPVVNDDLRKLLVNDSGIPQAKGKQYDIIRQGVNKGAITLKEVEAVKTFDDTNKLIQSVFSAGVYDARDVE